VHLCACHTVLYVFVGGTLVYPFVVHDVVGCKSIHDDVVVYCCLVAQGL